MITQNDMTMNSCAFISAGVNIDLVCDNQFPARPFIGPGAFTMTCGATPCPCAGDTAINSDRGYIRVYTARQPLNTICPTGQFINRGIAYFFVAGTLYIDTNEEGWCIYYPEDTLGVPFRILYKDGCNPLREPNVIVSELLVDLHPYNEFPGWAMIFWLNGKYADDRLYMAEPYYLRRRHLNLLNHPKTWSQTTGGRWAPLITSDMYSPVGYFSVEEEELAK